MRQQVVLPDQLQSEHTLLLIAFQQWQQRTVNTWLPFLEQLEANEQGLIYYELPVIQRMNILARTFINEGMRAGIPNQKARERTITLYLDKKQFRRSLDISHENDIQVLLINHHGQVMWRTVGAFTPDQGLALHKALRIGQRSSSLPGRSAADDTVLPQTMPVTN